MAGECIEETRLAGIRSSGEYQRAAVVQQPPLLRGRLERAEVELEPCQSLLDAALTEQFEVLVGKVDRRLDVAAQFYQRRFQTRNLGRELAAERIERRARSSRRTGADQVGHRLGLRQIELVVQERALRELSRPRRARAELEAALNQQRHHHRPAVPVQLQHVLAGEGTRRREVKRESRIDRRAGAIEESAQLCAAGLRQRADHSRGERRNERA